MSPEPLVTVRHGHPGTGAAVIMVTLDAQRSRPSAGDDADRLSGWDIDRDRIGAGADVRLVDCRLLTPDGVRRTLTEAKSVSDGPAWAIGVIGAVGVALDTAVGLGATYVVDQGGADPAQLAALALGDTVVVVAGRESLRRDESVLDVRTRHDDLTARGTPAASLVLELPVGWSRSREGMAARATGTPMGVVIDSIASPEDLGRPDGEPGGGVDAGDTERGRSIGLLTGDLVAGIATVRTDDPRTAQRVRAVVAHLVGAAIAAGGLDLTVASERTGPLGEPGSDDGAINPTAPVELGR